MNCSSCGANLPPGAAVCPVCGTPTPYNVPGPGSSAQYDPTVAAPPYVAPPPPATAYGSPGYSTPSYGTPSTANPYEPLAPNPYAVPPAPPAQPGSYGIAPPYTQPAPRRRSRVGLIIGIVALVLILACVGTFAALYQVGKQTLDAQATATAQTQAKLNATATAGAIATATQVASVYPFSNNLVLDDPLKDNSKGYKWDEVTNQNGGACKFEGQAYHATQSQGGYFNPCYAAKTNFSNFTYQVQMTITQGDAGGLIFRADSQNTKLYYLRMTESGSFSLFLYVDNIPSHTRTLAHDTASNFNSGFNQTNLIGVVANGDAISIFVNSQQITRVTDSTYSSGQIAVLAESFGKPTEVVYSNAKVWAL